MENIRIITVAMSVVGVILITVLTIGIPTETKASPTPSTMDNLRNGFQAAFGSTESAPYDVLDTKEAYEIRKYPARKWAATSMSGGIDRSKATSAMFRKLFNYISGTNSQSMSIAMTTPVSIFYEPGEGPNCENKWTEAFYVPQIHQTDPPTAEDIFIEERPELTIYASRFGGYANDETIAVEATKLAEAIQASGDTGIEFATYYFAGYDSPFKPINRRNEIWYVKKEAN